MARGALERFGMPDVVLFARHGDDVRLEVREEAPTPAPSGCSGPRWRATGHHRHEPDGERDECNEDRGQ